VVVLILKYFKYLRLLQRDRDPDTRTQAMDMTLREICRKFKEKGDPNFSQEELHKLLEGWRPNYLDMNFRNLLKGSGYLDIDDNFNLTLTENGKQFCRDNKW
jgi:hypothetical protein